MYWGCMTYHGVGPITPIQGTMDANKYIPIINDKVVPEMNERFPDGDGTFQQDLAPCHRAKKVHRVFRDNGVMVLDWPGNSPDLNPLIQPGNAIPGIFGTPFPVLQKRLIDMRD